MRFIILPRETPPDPDNKELGSCDVADENFSNDVAAAYMRYNEELARAGVLVAAEGLNPNDPAVQVGVADGKRVVLDGPFTEAKELVGGFYIIDVPSKADALKWALRCPIGLGHEVLEIRKLTELEDLPAEFQKMIKDSAPTWRSSRWPA